MFKVRGQRTCNRLPLTTLGRASVLDRLLGVLHRIHIGQSAVAGDDCRGRSSNTCANTSSEKPLPIATPAQRVTNFLVDGFVARSRVQSLKHDVATHAYSSWTVH